MPDPYPPQYPDSGIGENPEIEISGRGRGAGAEAGRMRPWSGAKLAVMIGAGVVIGLALKACEWIGG